VCDIAEMMIRNVATREKNEFITALACPMECGATSTPSILHEENTRVVAVCLCQTTVARAGA
jgi:hypothetical protein